MKGIIMKSVVAVDQKKKIARVHATIPTHNLFENDRIEHSTQALYNVILHECVDFLLQMPLWILFAHIFDGQLFGCHLFFLFKRLLHKKRNQKEDFV